MKQLDQLNPGTPIGSAPFLIDTPGRYYLTSNLAGQGAEPAVHITSSNVTLDLNGFALTDGSFPIQVFHPEFAQLHGIVVTNGHLPGGNSGLFFANVSSSTVSNLNIMAGSGVGIRFTATGGGSCDGNRVLACTVGASGEGGIDFSAADGSTCNGNLVKSSLVSGTSLQGAISFVAGLGGECRGNVVEDCFAGDGSDSNYASFSFSGGSGSTAGNRLQRCASFGAGQVGIFVRASDPGHADGNVVRHCAVANSGWSGISVEANGTQGGVVSGNRVESCAVARSGFGELSPDDDSGIQVGGHESVTCRGNSVTGCVVFRSENAGIWLESAEGTRIEGNHVNTADVGVAMVFGTANFLSGSSISGSIPELSQTFNSTNTVGPQVFSAGIIPNGTHWLANFARP